MATNTVLRLAIQRKGRLSEDSLNSHQREWH